MRAPIVFFGLFCSPIWAQAVGTTSLRGFAPQSVDQERQWETKAQALPDPAHIDQYLKQMSRRPHLAGTPRSKWVAEYALSQFKSWGLDAHIEEFEALLPTPKTRVLEMVSPRPFRAKLSEPPVSADPSSFDKDEIPTYNAYSGSGDVTAPLIYVNYGMPEDYDYLAKIGLNVKGKIVITRYGGGWRGLKPRLAAEHGAVGCLIYSDPKDDGYYRGNVFPKGMWRPENGVQRGSVVDMTLYPGDPLSPGWASEKGSRRLAIAEAQTLMKVPVLPISYGDAGPLMEQLGGPVAPDNWRGAFGFTYHIGGVDEKVHLKVEMDNSIHPLYDVIARIEGARFPNEWVLAGNHHDAWVHGALDPLSGASCLLETARTLAALQKQGWHPARTLMFALWDGEEFGLVGSTEYAEKHADELSKKLVAYVNSDTTGKGQLGAGGSHILEEFVSELTRDIPDPVSGKPLADSMRSQSSGQTKQATGKHDAPQAWHMEALGSGSDYTSFLQHLGIASLNFGFGDENGAGGVYHSAYDSYYWYTHFGDPGFVYSKTFSIFTSTLLLRLTGADLIPVQFTSFVDSLTRYADEIQPLIHAPADVSLNELRAEIANLHRSASDFEASYGRVLTRFGNASPTQISTLNRLLFGAERKMLLPSGLPRRNWFRHAIYAPGSLTGYGVKTLPGTREALEANHPDEAKEQTSRIVETLRALNQEIQEAVQAANGI